MKVLINGEQRSIDNSQISITDLLILEKVGNADMVSVQKNGEFVARNEFDTLPISDGDEIDFLFFMGGGQNSYEF